MRNPSAGVNGLLYGLSREVAGVLILAVEDVVRHLGGRRGNKNGVMWIHGPEGKSRMSNTVALSLYFSGKTGCLRSKDAKYSCPVHVHGGVDDYESVDSNGTRTKPDRISGSGNASPHEQAATSMKRWRQVHVASFCQYDLYWVAYLVCVLHQADGTADELVATAVCQGAKASTVEFQVVSTTMVA